MYSIEDSKFIALIEKGLPLEVLLRRLWPAYDFEKEEWNEWTREFTEEEWDEHKDVFSGEGFIGKDENLLELIHSDWQVVERYGTTHGAISKALEKVLATKYPIRVEHRVSSERWRWEYKTVLPNHQLNPDYEFADWIEQAKLVKNYLSLEFNLPFGFISETNNQGGWEGCPWGCGRFDGNHGLIIRRDLPKDEKVMAYLDNAEQLDDVIDIVDRQTAKTISSSKEAYLRRRNEIPFYAPITGLLPHLIREHYFFEGRKVRYRADTEFLIHALDLAK